MAQDCNAIINHAESGGARIFVSTIAMAEACMTTSGAADDGTVDEMLSPTISQIAQYCTELNYLLTELYTEIQHTQDHVERVQC